MHKGDGFQQNLLENTHFIGKMSGPAMVRPASSDFWIAPESLATTTATTTATATAMATATLTRTSKEQ